MKIRAAAKINLALDVCGRTPNGYHELKSIFQTVGLYDEITVELTDGGIGLTCEVPEKFAGNDPIPCDERNIAYKTARRFFEENGLDGGCRIHIKKGIPSQAGMGGGSADAAAVIYCLSRLTGKELTAPEKIGADVPFFLTGGTAYVEGIGEKITKIRDYSGKMLVIAKGSECVSTAEAYRLIDETDLSGCPPVRAEEMKRAINGGEDIAEYVGNTFEYAVKLGEVDDIKAKMRSFGAAAACMTGSGSAVFGIFDDVHSAEICASALSSCGYFAQPCPPVPKAFEEI